VWAWCEFIGAPCEHNVSLWANWTWCETIRIPMLPWEEPARSLLWTRKDFWGSLRKIDVSRLWFQCEHIVSLSIVPCDTYIPWGESPWKHIRTWCEPSLVLHENELSWPWFPCVCKACPECYVNMMLTWTLSPTFLYCSVGPAVIWTPVAHMIMPCSHSKFSKTTYL
jgi:hypothetical protein